MPEGRTCLRRRTGAVSAPERALSAILPGKVVKVGKVGKANCNVEVKWADGDTGRHNFSCSEYAGASIEDVQLGECEPGTWYIAEVLVVDEQAEGGSGEGEEEEEEAEEEEKDGEETAPASRAVSGGRARAAQRG